MKKLLFIALVSALLVGIRLNSYSQVLEGPPRDGVFERQALPQQQPIPYVYLREADIVWTKRIWRTIDMREKINQPFYYPEQPQNTWKSFVQILIDGINLHYTRALLLAKGKAIISAQILLPVRVHVPLAYASRSSALNRTIRLRRLVRRPRGQRRVGVRRIQAAIELHLRGMRADGVRPPRPRQRTVVPGRTSRQVDFYATVEVAA